MFQLRFLLFVAAAITCLATNTASAQDYSVHLELSAPAMEALLNDNIRDVISDQIVLGNYQGSTNPVPLTDDTIQAVPGTPTVELTPVNAVLTAGESAGALDLLLPIDVRYFSEGAVGTHQVMVRIPMALGVSDDGTQAQVLVAAQNANGIALENGPAFQAFVDSVRAGAGNGPIGAIVEGGFLDAVFANLQTLTSNLNVPLPALSDFADADVPWAVRLDAPGGASGIRVGLFRSSATASQLTTVPGLIPPALLGEPRFAISVPPGVLTELMDSKSVGLMDNLASSELADQIALISGQLGVPLLNTGNATFTAGDDIVVGADTDWTATVREGFALVRNGNVTSAGRVAEVIDNTHLRLAQPWSGTSTSSPTGDAFRAFLVPTLTPATAPASGAVLGLVADHGNFHVEGIKLTKISATCSVDVALDVDIRFDLAFAAHPGAGRILVDADHTSSVVATNADAHCGLDIAAEAIIEDNFEGFADSAIGGILTGSHTRQRTVEAMFEDVVNGLSAGLGTNVLLAPETFAFNTQGLRLRAAMTIIQGAPVVHKATPSCAPGATLCTAAADAGQLQIQAHSYGPSVALPSVSMPPAWDGLFHVTVGASGYGAVTRVKAVTGFHGMTEVVAQDAWEPVADQGTVFPAVPGEMFVHGDKLYVLQSVTEAADGPHLPTFQFLELPRQSTPGSVVPLPWETGSLTANTVVTGEQAMDSTTQVWATDAGVASETNTNFDITGYQITAELNLAAGFVGGSPDEIEFEWDGNPVDSVFTISSVGITTPTTHTLAANVLWVWPGGFELEQVITTQVTLENGKSVKTQAENTVFGRPFDSPVRIPRLPVDPALRHRMNLDPRILVLAAGTEQAWFFDSLPRAAAYLQIGRTRLPILDGRIHGSVYIDPWLATRLAPTRGMTDARALVLDGRGRATGAWFPVVLTGPDHVDPNWR